MNSLVPQTPQHSLPVSTGGLPVRSQEPEGLDFTALFEAARRRYFIFLSVFALVLALAVVLTLHQKPKYTATSSVMMDPRQCPSLRNSHQVECDG